MKILKNKALLGFATIAVASMFMHDVRAQVAVSDSDANSRSNSRSDSSSVSGSRSQVGNTAANVNISQPGGTTYANAPSDVTVRSAPTVYVPGVITGNVCALGASAGASWLGAGFAVGTSWESEQCENRQRAALLHNMGYKLAAKELACDNRSTYNAFRVAGEPCAIRPDWEPKGVAGTQPVGQPVNIRPAPQTMPVQPMFNASNYPTGAECLNAASALGAPFSECAGKR